MYVGELENLVLAQNVSDYKLKFKLTVQRADLVCMKKCKCGVIGHIPAVLGASFTVDELGLVRMAECKFSG